jgi:hypothetical protein
MNACLRRLATHNVIPLLLVRDNETLLAVSAAAHGCGWCLVLLGLCKYKYPVNGVSPAVQLAVERVTWALVHWLHPGDSENECVVAWRQAGCSPLPSRVEGATGELAFYRQAEICAMVTASTVGVDVRVASRARSA